MSVSTSTNRYSYTGNNVLTAYSFPALFYDSTHLAVYLDGVLQTTGYTVSGAADPAGGTVTFSIAPGTGVIINILRTVPITQQVTLNVAGAFPAKTVEKALDLAVMANQQFDEILDRAITLPVDSTLTAADIPDPGDPANYNKALKIAGDGSGLDVFDVSTTPFSSVVTTKGDIAIFGASAVDRLPIGANNTILIADSTQARGLKWAASITGLALIDPNISGTVNGLPNFNSGIDVHSTANFFGGVDITGSGSAGQIFFPSTQNPHANANCLDDYEEGTWTPSVGGTATYTSRTGTYTKIGNTVTLYCAIAINTIGTGSTTQITGCPFTAANTAVGACYWSTAANTFVYVAARLVGTTISIVDATAATASLGSTAFFGNGANIEFSLTFKV